MISSPALRLYNSCLSSTGASYSSNPVDLAVSRNFSYSHRCSLNSSGYQSLVPEHASNSTGGVVEHCTVTTPPAFRDLSAAAFAFASLAASFAAFFAAFSASRFTSLSDLVVVPAPSPSSSPPSRARALASSAIARLTSSPHSRASDL